MSIDDNRFKLAYAREKFGQALQDLATEPGIPSGVVASSLVALCHGSAGRFAGRRASRSFCWDVRGERVEKIAVWKKDGAGEHTWEGLTTKKARTFFIGLDTPIITALSHACFVIAGEVGEKVLDPDKYRAGTALDEVLFSQRIASALANRVKMEAENLWQEIRKRSWEIIAHNEPVARELIARLDRTETLQRQALRTPLEGVQKIPNDWRWLPQRTGQSMSPV
jgi:hypothetical protein